MMLCGMRCTLSTDFSFATGSRLADLLFIVDLLVSEIHHTYIILCAVSHPNNYFSAVIEHLL